MKKQSKEDLSMFSKEVLIGLIDYMQQALKYQKERIDKAIEYINEMCLCSDSYANYGDDLRPKHIVDILRGKDNDSK